MPLEADGDVTDKKEEQQQAMPSFVEQTLASSASANDQEVFTMTLRLVGMAALPQHSGASEGEDECPIAMQPFDKARVDFLPEDAAFVKGRPDLCIAVLPCKHKFHSLSILSHMALSCMRCPVCR
jgi:hypothetical protein